MNKNISLCVSSCTGNTKKVADALSYELKKQNWNISIYNNVKEDIIINDDIVIVCFWCRKSTLDTLSQKIVDKLNDKNVIAFGTMGGYPDSSYGKRVYKNVEDYINKENKCIGVYILQGRISPERTERRRKLPKDSPHYLDEEGLKRHIESRKHPDENDIQEAVEFLNKKILLKDINYSENSVCMDGEPCIRCGMCSYYS